MSSEKFDELLAMTEPSIRMKDTATQTRPILACTDHHYQHHSFLYFVIFDTSCMYTVSMVFSFLQTSSTSMFSYHCSLSSSSSFSNDHSLCFCSCNLDIKYFITVHMSHTNTRLLVISFTFHPGAHYNIKI
jgi:hypothetical protein